MKTMIRTGIVAVAGTVALGTLGFAAAANADDADPVLKREETSSAVVQDVDVDDLDDDLDPRSTDNPTTNTVQTRNTAPTKNTVKTVNSAPTKNTAPTNDTAPTGPTSGTS